MAISAGGLLSGLDTSSIIEQLVSIEKGRQDPINRSKAFDSSEKTAVLELNTKLTSLVSSLTKMDGLSEDTLSLAESEEVLSTKSSTSDENAVAVTTTATATAGVFDIDVTTLATAARRDHSGVADATAVLSASDAVFSFSYAGGAAETVAIKGGETTLEGLRDAINGLEDGKVRATIIDTGITGPNRHRLVLDGEETGLSKTVAVDAGTTLAGFAEADFGTTAPKNASFTLNGITISSESNSASPVDGVTFDLLEEGASATITVETDIDALRGKIEGIADKANAVIDFIREQSKFNEKTGTGGILNGDALVSRLEGAVRRALGASVESGTFTSLRDLGLDFESNGRVSFDSDKLTEALKDPEAVRTLLNSTQTTSPNGLAAQMAAELKVYSNNDDGLLQNRIESLEQRIERYDDRIEVLNTRADRYRRRLEKQFTGLEKALAGLSNAQQFFANNQIGIYS